MDMGRQLGLFLGVNNIFGDSKTLTTLQLLTLESLPSRMYHGKFIAKEDYPALIATSDM